MVSVQMLAFNHERHIAGAIEGVLGQRTSFGLELVLGEDCSTDSTRRICEEYARRFPQTVRLLPSITNLGITRNGIRTLRACCGKYVAICEGDDYWTDSCKLQKQVDFLEANPEFALTAGGFIRHDESTGEREEIIVIPPWIQASGGGYAFGLADTKDVWMTKILTLLFRNNGEIANQLSAYKHGRDINLVYHLLKNGGKGYYFTEIFGVYRVHEGGIFSQKREEGKKNVHYQVYKELYRKNRDEFTRYMSRRATLDLLRFNLFTDRRGRVLTKQIRLLVEAWLMVRKPKDVRQVLGAFLPEKFKAKFRKKA